MLIATLASPGARADEEYTTITETAAVEYGGASGGDEIRKIDNDDGYTYDLVHIYTNVTEGAAFSLSDATKVVDGSLQFLVVGGGGAGGGNCGGGGGAGGLIYLDGLTLAAGSGSITVGEGGTGGDGSAGGNGSDSTLVINGTTYTAVGGGGGGYWGAGVAADAYGVAGGSGGGACGGGTPGAAQQPDSASGGYGYRGGFGGGTANGGNNRAGGGGGAGGAGGAGVANGKGGDGGAGLQYGITGVAQYYAGGGGGASVNGAGAGTGGSGVGGNGGIHNAEATTAGQNGTGSGGGGTDGGGTYGRGPGKAGGSGIVVIRYTVDPGRTIVEFDGQTIEALGATVNWVNGEPVFKFTDVNRAGTLTIPAYMRAWVLAVGGGGAGANPSTTASAARGGAGGGGAGGFVEETGAWIPGDYVIQVGPGGVSPSDYGNGGNGSNSVVTVSGAAKITAYGGGGGGILGPGEDGGSGGGGSCTTTTQSGGSPVDSSQGYAGGDGVHTGTTTGKVNGRQSGAGGGGAGGKGDDVAGNNQGANGGPGKASFIESDLGIYYAGGGGGGSRGHSATASTGGTGGTGGGGNGGYGTSSSKTKATDGTDGLGGGGGGGCYGQAGGDGGSGVVIIRLICTMPDKPTPTEVTQAYDGAEHIAIAEHQAYTITDKDGAEVTGDATVKNVGEYSFTATLNDGYCWSDGSTDAVTVTWTITKPSLVVDSFTQNGWLVGEDPEEPDLVVLAGEGGAVVTLADDQVTYTYSSSSNGTYIATAPTTTGVWYVKATIEGTDDFAAPAEEPIASFRIWSVLGYTSTFTVSDLGTATYTDYPLLVEISEGTPENFSYEATAPDGSDIRFIDEDGNSLAYTITTWNTAGTSTIWVEVPEYVDGTTITMTWGAVYSRLYDVPEGEIDTTTEQVGTVTKEAAVEITNGVLPNVWTVEPDTSTTTWAAGERPYLDVGDSRFGDDPYFVIVPAGSTTALTNDYPTTAGAYSLYYRVDGWTSTGDWGTWGWEELVKGPIAVTVTAHSPRYDLSGASGSATRSGRVLLANDDTNTTAPISGQAYANTEESNEVYWTHDESTTLTYPALYPNLQIATAHTLSASNAVEELCGDTAIWTLKDVCLGSTYNPTTSADNIADRNLLPYSSTSATSDDAAYYMVMRNETNAVIQSACYTNGIGTIYFDAVNGSLKDAGTGYNIVVEIIEGVTTNVDEIAEEDWTAVEMKPILMSGTVGSSQSATEELALNVTTGGYSKNNFYRVVVPLNIYGPVRFRIRRTSTSGSYTDDRGGFILVDNIVASYPPMRADLSTYGIYDESKSGKETIGWEGSWQTPFPYVGASVSPRAKATFTTTPADTNANVSAFITGATLHYRWRYLDQQVTDWRTAALDPSALTAGNTLLSSTAVMDLTNSDGDNLVGDIEFWYDLVLNAPYYLYVDYAGLNGFKMSDFHLEEIAAVTNHADGAAFYAASDDETYGFVRLREGASDYEAFDIEYIMADGELDGDALIDAATNGTFETVSMELTGNSTWRGYMQTIYATNLYFRIVGRNRQTAGAVEWATNETYYTVTDIPEATPVSQIMSEGTSTDWTNFAADAATGYLMFQVDDDTKSITIVHADYQNFNGWTDANKKGSLFVGSSTEDSLKAGASPTAVEWTETFDTWTDMPATNVYWTENFNSGVSFDAADYTPFASSTTINGWSAGNGMYVAANYKDTRLDAASGRVVVDRAIQLEGNSKGYIQFVNAGVSPRGLEKVSFTTRLGQFIDFGDFSYYDAEGKSRMTNYTFTARGTFDVNKWENFRGNASLSLVAYYRPGVGCYEFRMEQALGWWKNGSAGVHQQGQIYSLYRWTYDKSSGRLTCDLLGSRTNETHFAHNLQLTQGTGGTYTPMYLSISNSTDGAVCIMAGVKPAGMKQSDSLSAMSNGTWDSICYRDTSSSKLTAGTYGLLTANCEGRFILPYQLASPVPFLSDFTTLNKLDQYSAKAISFNTTSPHNCKADITNGDWVVTPGRMEADTSTSTWGLKYLKPSQTINIYKTASGKTTGWELLKTITTSSFGTADSLSYNFYTTEDSSLKITAGGDAYDMRTDVILDDIEMRQWRGNGWDDDNEMVKLIPNWTSEDLPKAHTNFVFGSCWIKDKSLLMSAKRTSTDTDTYGPCYIRSPLFDGSYGRGIGLGMISFSYKNAQANVNLLVQVATNVTFDTIANYNTLSDDQWTTVTNYSFANLSSAELASGTRSCYVGLHGVRGAMRILMDPTVVNNVLNVTDTSKFGEIYITDVYCRDEPVLDQKCWWGWNLRTLGIDSTGADGEGRMYLPDYTTDASAVGQSLALNNSVTADIVAVNKAAYPQHLPFLQSPTFGTNIVGEVAFRARKYSESDQPALVCLYGSVTGDEDGAWTRLAAFTVSNTTYKTYSYKTEQGKSYMAFRLAVTGVDGVTGTEMDKTFPESYPYTTPVRVLIDEAMVSEAVRARVGFRNVGAFDSHLDGYLIVPDVPSAGEQPLCGESWGIQCELYKAQLPDEIDFDLSEEKYYRRPRVFLHWYEKMVPWGYDNWKEQSTAKVAELVLAEGATETNMVYRSGYLIAPKAVLGPYATPGTTIQYSLEAVYYQVGGTTPITNVLTSAGWTKPEWYRGIDYNSLLGKNTAFSAYTILDSVAPYGAWFNEVNIFSEYASGKNLDKGKQYVELAVPAAADLTGWSVNILAVHDTTSTIITNSLGKFGSDVPATKTSAKEIASGMRFPVLASPATKTAATLDATKGEVDAYWPEPPATTATTEFTSGGEIMALYPVALQLVRPSGIVEHEVVVVGTNMWNDPILPESLRLSHDPTNTVNVINRLLASADAAYFFAGEDCGGTEASLGVFESCGETSNVWNNVMGHTPGKINEGQTITLPRLANGTSLIVYANVDTELGRIYQTVGDAVETTEPQILFVKQGDDSGLTITYTLDQWYVLGSVLTNGIAVTEWKTNDVARSYDVTIARNSSNDVEVVAYAKLNDTLADRYGLTPDDPYTPAIVEWLEEGTTLKGSFANPDSEEIYLADFISHWTHEVISQMSLKEMYWLDMDPTVGNLALEAGFATAATPIKALSIEPDTAVTNQSSNISMSVFMMITNRVEDAADPNYGKAWTPYVLRGVEPGLTSWDYADNEVPTWDSVTFKITGIPVNGRSKMSEPDDWVQLRWFVFTEDSFLPLTDSDNPGTSYIEVADPHTPESPGYWDGIKEWPDAQIYYRWALDTRYGMYGVEVLQPTNKYWKATN